MIRFPNAKINLGLQITGKRNDGYHDLETVFFPVQWCDALEVVPSMKGNDACSLEMKGVDFDDYQSNLCYKAWKLLNDDFNLPPIKIYLHKFIPHGAGLGGGSSDAAFTLRMLNDHFNLKLSTEQLLAYATKLGSDCAFFIYNSPMIATGRGEILKPVSLNLEKYYIVIVKPEISVSTVEAYGIIQPKKPDLPLEAVIQLPVNEWKYALVNDFENPVFEKYPEIAAIKKKLYISGAVYAAMSGSGSAVFGIFKKAADIETTFSEHTFWTGKL